MIIRTVGGGGVSRLGRCGALGARIGCNSRGDHVSVLLDRRSLPSYCVRMGDIALLNGRNRKCFPSTIAAQKRGRLQRLDRVTLGKGGSILFFTILRSNVRGMSVTRRVSRRCGSLLVSTVREKIVILYCRTRVSPGRVGVMHGLPFDV